MTTETQHETGWIACRRCSGSGTVNWAGGTRSGPCFLCNGTGDGRIKNQNGFGPRRGHKGNGRVPVLPGDGSLPADTESDDTESDDSLPLPSVLPQHLTAAEHLAAALAGLQQSAPVDADMVRQILASEMSESRRKLESMIDSAVASRALLAEAIAGIPRKLVVTWNGRDHDLPAVRHHTFEKLFRLVKAGKRVYLVGPAGSGKTTACRQIADALGLTFYYQGAMSGSHCILGHNGLHHYQTTPTREAWEKGGLLLIDEIDGSEPDAALSIHPMDNGHMTFPDCPTPIARHPDFRMIVAANTYGKGADRIYVGRTQLDGATLNRFIPLEWNYDETLERQIAGDTEWTTFVQKARGAIDKLKIRHVLSPRNAIDANDLHALGFERSEVEAMAVWQGMADADIARVREAM